MFFESLSGLWFGWTLPVIVAMYLLKRKYIDTEVPSHLLWNRALRELEANRPWQKLRNQLLMILQLLVAALLVLAIAQPFALTEQRTKPHVVIVLDRSASMSAAAAHDAAEGGESVSSRLEQAKRQIVDWVREEADGSEITLIATGAEPDIPLSRSSSPGELERVLDTIEPFYGVNAYQETLSLASALTRDDANAEIRLFTDGQWAGNTAGLSFSAPVYVEKPAALRNDNVSIVRFGVTGQQAEFKGVATVKNWGEAPAQMQVSVYTEQTLSEVKQVNLEGGEQKSVFFDRLSDGDYYKAVLDVEDGMSVDNEAYAFAAGDSRRTALLVSDGNLFLEKALQLSNLDVIKASGTRGERAVPDSRIDLVVVDGIPVSELSGAQWNELLAVKPVWYIHAWDGKEVALSGADYTFADHPVTRFVRFQDTHIASAGQIEAPPWGEPVASSGRIPLIYAGEQDGRPRLAFTFDLRQSDLPLRSEFPILVRNAIGWLMKNEAASLGKAVVAETLEIAVNPEAVQAQWQATDARAGHAGYAAEMTGGAVAVKQTVPPVPGLYRFVESGASGNVIAQRYLEVTADPRESNIGFAPDLQFEGAGQPQGIAAGEPGEASGSDDRKRPSPLLPWLAALALAAMAAEWGVYQRGHSI